MNLTLLNKLLDPAQSEFEIVERKGRGHPDTLSDRLAELLSRTYCKLSREKFGTVLRHQFDKLTLMGGKCNVRFGGGNFVSPIRLLINGRATPEVGNDKLFYRDILIDTASKFLESELRNFDFLTNCRIMLETTVNTTRGILLDDQPANHSSAYSRFRPGKLTDLPEYTNPIANDTAVGCGWAPYTAMEKLVLEIEAKLNSNEIKKAYPWLGSDIKIMAIRTARLVKITLCVPQVSTSVNSIDEYRKNLQTILEIIKSVTNNFSDFFKVDIFLNTGDGIREDLLYMLYTGSCIESGDEGQVGRGNRLGGVISSRRPFSIEGLNGKNPQYHAGKIYSVIAWELAQKIWKDYKVSSEVFITSQSDKPLSEPWSIIVNSTGELDKISIHEILEEMLADIGGFTNRIISGEYPLA